MNKRGQMYILAAVLLCVAIFGIIKVTNRLELPADTNFDFYVENFKGERAYVYDMGFLGNGGEITRDIIKEDGLLDIFAKFGTGTGIVFAEYKDNNWKVINYLGKDISTEIKDKESGAKEVVVIPSGQGIIGSLSFEIGRKYYIEDTKSNKINEKYFTQTFQDTKKIKIIIDGNEHIFDSKGKDKIESIVFQNVDENYVKVVRL